MREWTGETPRPVRPRRKLPDDPGRDTRHEFSDRIVHVLAEHGALRSKDLAERLNIPLFDVRQELIELEMLGIVYRTGQTRGTRWWLG